MSTLLATLAILRSVEFYVILAVCAAAIVGFMAMQRGTGPVRTWSLRGRLSDQGDDQPSIELTARDDGSVVLARHGLSQVSNVDISVSLKGFDVQIEERLYAGAYRERVDTATFTLDFMGRERYFISYRNHNLGLFAAVSMKNAPGNHITKDLQ